ALPPEEGSPRQRSRLHAPQVQAPLGEVTQDLEERAWLVLYPKQQTGAVPLRALRRTGRHESEAHERFGRVSDVGLDDGEVRLTSAALQNERGRSGLPRGELEAREGRGCLDDLDAGQALRQEAPTGGASCRGDVHARQVVSAARRDEV